MGSVRFVAVLGMVPVLELQSGCSFALFNKGPSTPFDPVREIDCQSYASPAVDLFPGLVATTGGALALSLPPCSSNSDGPCASTVSNVLGAVAIAAGAIWLASGAYGFYAVTRCKNVEQLRRACVQRGATECDFPKTEAKAPAIGGPCREHADCPINMLCDHGTCQR